MVETDFCRRNPRVEALQVSGTHLINRITFCLESFVLNTAPYIDKNVESPSDLFVSAPSAPQPGLLIALGNNLFTRGHFHLATRKQLLKLCSRSVAGLNYGLEGTLVACGELLVTSGVYICVYLYWREGFISTHTSPASALTCRDYRHITSTFEIDFLKVCTQGNAFHCVLSCKHIIILCSNSHSLSLPSLENN